jgi:hypothetical protein
VDEELKKADRRKARRVAEDEKRKALGRAPSRPAAPASDVEGAL